MELSLPFCPSRLVRQEFSLRFLRENWGIPVWIPISFSEKYKGMELKLYENIVSINILTSIFSIIFQLPKIFKRKYLYSLKILVSLFSF